MPLSQIHQDRRQVISTVTLGKGRPWDRRTQAAVRCRYPDWLAAGAALLAQAGAVAGAMAGALTAEMPGTTAGAGAAAPATETVRVAPERDYGPFVYINAENQVQGLSIELLQRLQPWLGWRLEMQPARPLADQLAAARRGEVDLITSLRPTPERAAYLNFTRPYVAVPAVLVQRQGQPTTDLVGLRAQPVAVGRGYAVEGYLRLRHPQVRWVPMDDDAQALAALRRGEVQAVVADVASTRFIIGREGWRDLVPGRPIGFDYALAFGVRRDRPDLVLALDRALMRRPLAERDTLFTRWVGPAATETRDPLRRALEWIGALITLLGALGWWWLRRRQRSALLSPRS